MAGASDKKVAKNNAATLKIVHTVSFVANIFSLACLFSFSRPPTKWPYFVFNIPAWACEWFMEAIGRPQYRTDSVRGYEILVNPGQDLAQPGLTEYMFDVFYLTQICDVLMGLFGSNKPFYLLLLVPAYALYKAFTIYQTLKGGLAGPSNPAPADDPAAQPAKSKRQQKREARQNKPKYSRH